MCVKLENKSDETESVVLERLNSTLLTRSSRFVCISVCIMSSAPSAARILRSPAPFCCQGTGSELCLLGEMRSTRFRKAQTPQVHGHGGPWRSWAIGCSSASKPGHILCVHQCFSDDKTCRWLLSRRRKANLEMLGSELHYFDRSGSTISFDHSTWFSQVAIEPATKADLEKLGNGLHKLGQEDPSFHHQRDEENNQTVGNNWAKAFLMQSASARMLRLHSLPLSCWQASTRPPCKTCPWTRGCHMLRFCRTER